MDRADNQPSCRTSLLNSCWFPTKCPSRPTGNKHISNHEPTPPDYRYNKYDAHNARNDKFYIQKIKPFFVNHKIYYEITFTLSNVKVCKFDRIIAFTDHDISQYYAVKLFIMNDSIEILDKTMPIYIIVKWEVSIRPCEIENFSSLSV